MRSVLVILFIISLLGTKKSSAQAYKFAAGVGAEAGTNNYFVAGISSKLFLGGKSAIELNALTGKPGYNLSLLYQYHFPFDNARQFSAYAGIGIFNVIYPRAALGFEYKPLNVPLVFAADWRPFYEWRVDDDIDNRGLYHFGCSVRYVLKK